MSARMHAPAGVNSREYWERRFATDWDAHGGRQQSRAFMDLLVKHLPAALHEETAREGLSILDCGCAMGDGTAVLAAEFPRSQVGGFDWSGAAVEAARRAYPGLDFFVSDLEGLERRADLLVASHCLEHLDAPVGALRHLLGQARRYLLLLVPFLESYPPHHEHRRVIHAGTLPEALDGWRVIHRFVIPPVASWAGNQLLLVYQPARSAEPVELSPLPSVVEVDRQMRLRAVEGAVAGLAAGIQQVGGELAAAREAVESGLCQLAAELAQLRGTAAVGAAAEREAAALRARLDQAERELAERERAELEQAERELAEREAAALRARLDQAELEQAEREAAALRARLDQAEREQAEREAAVLRARLDQAELEQAEREAAVLRARLDQAEREQAEQEELLAEAARELAARDERVRGLEDELRRGHGFVQALQEERDRTVAGLGEQVEGLRVELESWRWDATTARRELAHLQSSRLWRLANVYWGARRRLGLLDQPRRAAAPLPEGAPAAWPARREQAGGLPALPPGFPQVPACRYDVIVFSIIDWDFRFQRPQQLATQLGRHGHRVFYLSTSAFLPADGPAWTMAWKARNVVELKLRSRRALDIYAGRLEEADLACLEAALADLLETLALGDVACLVQIPFWAPLTDRLRARFGWRVVYDCMDEWTNFPGFGAAVLALEEGLVREADLTVATARLLYEKLAGRAARLLLAQNGVDLEHYRQHYGANDLLGPVAHPVIGYYGALASWVDAELLGKIARRFPAATVVLAGGVFDVDLSAVEHLPNVRLLGQRPYEEMPLLLWHFDACVIPFLVNDITEATNPVKLYEYLSAGKPVVAPRLTELLPFADLCYLAGGHDEFLDCLERALTEPADDPRRERRREVAEANDWRERYAAIDRALAETFPLVSVVMVTHGGLPLTRRCLESLLEGETWPRLEVLVVDNASPDGTPEHLRALAAADPRVCAFFEESNRGFPAATNAGLGQARGEVVLLLNNDTVVPPGMIGRLVRALAADPKVGLVCATTNFCGNEARVEPGYEDLADMPRFAAARARRYAGRLFDLRVAAMYCAALRREVAEEIGPLDEAFGIGMFEDDDYSLRVRQAGYRVVCAEDAYVHHVGQGSFQNFSAQEYEALWSRNQAHYEKKWNRKWKPHTLRSGVVPVMSKVGRSR